MPEHAANQHLNNENHRNTYRARAIWKDWADYAERTPAGSVIRSGRLQRVLRAQAEDDHVIETWTAKRVMAVGGWDSFQAIEPYLNAPTPKVVNDAFENADLA